MTFYSRRLKPNLANRLLNLNSFMPEQLFCVGTGQQGEWLCFSLQIWHIWSGKGSTGTRIFVRFDVLFDPHGFWPLHHGPCTWSHWCHIVSAHVVNQQSSGNICHHDDSLYLFLLMESQPRHQQSIVQGSGGKILVAGWHSCRCAGRIWTPFSCQGHHQITIFHRHCSRKIHILIIGCCHHCCSTQEFPRLWSKHKLRCPWLWTIAPESHAKKRPGIDERRLANQHDALFPSVWKCQTRLGCVGCWNSQVSTGRWLLLAHEPFQPENRLYLLLGRKTMCSVHKTQETNSLLFRLLSSSWKYTGTCRLFSVILGLFKWSRNFSRRCISLGISGIYRTLT